MGTYKIINSFKLGVVWFNSNGNSVKDMEMGAFYKGQNEHRAITKSKNLYCYNELIFW